MKEVRNRINEQIKIQRLRLINQSGKQIGIVSLIEAKKEAKKASLDLVEIQPNANPPVVRIMDYGKFLFQQNKQRNVQKKKQKQAKIKEIKFRPNTDIKDYKVKLRNLIGFLEDGDKVKVTIWFRGREITHQKFGIKLLERIKDDLKNHGKIEFYPKLEGRQLIMVLSPKKHS